MAFENMEQAAAALAEAVSSPEGSSAPVEAAQETQPAANQPVVEPTTISPTEGVQEPQTTPEEEGLLASRNIDLSELDDTSREWLQAREREMQSVMTQRTQEAAEARRQAEEATQFIQELNTNPFFAQQIVQNLSQQLQAAGFSPAQADAQALAQTQQVASQGQPDPNAQQYDEYGFEDDPYLSEIQKVAQRQDRIDAMLQAQAENTRIASLEAQLNNQAAYIQSQNPDIGDADMGKIINMAYAHGGDLVAAAEEYKAIKEAAVQDWISRKGSAPGPSTPPAGGSAQAPPQKFEGLHDPRLEQAALQRLNSVLGNS